MKFDKLPPAGKIHIGCLNCSTATRKAPIGFTPLQARQIAATLMQHSLGAEEIGHKAEGDECGATTKKEG